jgi:hypothetical protein
MPPTPAPRWSDKRAVAEKIVGNGYGDGDGNVFIVV